MATIQLEREVEIVLDCIKEGKNFILEGGAGSGKTYSLISLINALTLEYPEKTIACITYTNNAVAEIKSRIDNENLWVSTIHEFIWELIHRFQKEIKLELVKLINDDDEEFKIFNKPKEILEESVSEEYFKGLTIEYDEYYSMTPNKENKVKISHNHILVIAEKMFARYKKLNDILKDVANYIFVDEYQDTSPKVAKILLEHLNNSNKENVIGFFGDSMQAIYDDGIGDLNDYISEEREFPLERIIKKQNRRNPQIIIDIANKFREDGIEQEPSKDKNAPNMKGGRVIPGSFKFVYGNELEDIELLKEKDIFKDWNFSSGGETKELRLTHRYNAQMAGFKNLFELYKLDLITELLEKLKKKIKKDNLSTEGKTLEELALDIDPMYNKKRILGTIETKSEYKNSYEKIKNLQWDEALNKCKINKNSLLSYKFNGLLKQYEATSNRDRILKRLDLINDLIELYQLKKNNLFLKKTDFELNSNSDKKRLKEIMETFLNKAQSIGEVLEFAKKEKLIKEDDLFEDYIRNRGFYLWERIKNISFKEYINSIAYLKEYSPLCTHHSVKGSEYDNVLLILASDWKKYDFKTLFGRGSQKPSISERTKKLFYVSITRAKNNLVVYMPTNDSKIISKAKEYFGEENVFSLSEL